MSKAYANILTAAAIAAIIAPMLTLSGCGGNKATKIIVAPGYKKQFAINADLALVVLDESPKIIYLGDLAKSLGGDSKDTSVTGEELAWKFFVDQIQRDIHREIDVKDVFIAEVTQRYLVTRDFLRTADEDITVELPDNGTRFAFGSKEPALVLFIDQIRIGTETDPYFQERAQSGLYVTRARKLVYLATFVLWDNRDRKPICYGRVKTTVPISREEATIENWREVSRDFVRIMFEPTGFKKRADRTRGVELVR
jgi:hypothetical protein